MPQNKDDTQPTDDEIKVGRIIASTRTRYNMTGKALAKSIGISPTYVSMIERGNKPLTRTILLKINEVAPIPSFDIEFLWLHAKRGVGKEFKEAVTHPDITTNPDKEELLYSFAEALRRADTSEVTALLSELGTSVTFDNLPLRNRPESTRVSITLSNS